MSRLTSIFRRRGDETGPGQETEGQPAAASGAPTAPETPSFHDRGRLRRRLRYLRRVRELQLRDLGGLVYETYRMSRPRQDLVERKVGALAATDAELTGLEHALDDVRPLRELREPGIGGQCPRCGELFGTDARFCSHCGAGLAGEAAAALGQFGASTAAAPGAAPAGSPATPLAAPAGSPATPGARPAGSPAVLGAPPVAPPATASPGGAAPGPSPSGIRGGGPTPAPSPTPSGPGGPTPGTPPASSPVPKAPPPSGAQGIAAGDPLGQAPPAAPAEEPTIAISSGDPLAARPTPAEPEAKQTEPEAKPTEPEAKPAPAEPEAKPTEPEAKPTEPEGKPTEPPPADKAPAGDDETVVMPPAEQGGSGANGADESRAAKARTAGAQDEPE